jgi:Gpi18-like mannosyltransferase/predicted membrane-bound dolichyl-phosphate-mannose-protein mannosyltransferase
LDCKNYEAESRRPPCWLSQSRPQYGFICVENSDITMNRLGTIAAGGGRGLSRAAVMLLAMVAVTAIPAGAWAAAAPGASADGRLLGVVAGLVLIGVVAYSMLVYCRPLLIERDESLLWAGLLLLALALLKFAALPIFPGLGIDVGSYEAWAARMAQLGPAHMYQPGYFLDYPPGYLYALWAAGALVHSLGLSGDLMRSVVEAPAIIADLALAWLIFVMVRRTAPALAWIGMVLFAVNPAALFDTVVWGQSDSVFTFLMLLSVAMVVEDEFELGWAVAAVAVLTKPQALALLPILGLWTLLKAPRSSWLSSAGAFVAAGVVGAAPFQSGRSWSWLLNLYGSTAAYYHETSVNAFNFMGLIGGLRRADSITLLGVSYFTIGMVLLALMYLGLAYLLWRRPERETMFYVCFLTVFGFFMFAPRMHERYLYPALAFAVPIAVESSLMLLVLATISLAFLINLADVKHALEHNIFFAPHDLVATLVALVNTAALAAAAYWTWMVSAGEAVNKPLQLWTRAGQAISDRAAAAAPAGRDFPVEGRRYPSWLRLDTVILVVLLAAAGCLHFWRLGTPHEIVFDEVHFVGQARHYLHGEQFLDPHPPLAKLLIALGIWLFGDHSWSWRFSNAVVGTALIGITYLLGRRMFNSRLAGALSATFVLCDGMFVVDSRVAVIDIVYLTCAAASYLLFFRFLQAPGMIERRRTLLWMAVALGLCLGSKLYVPAVTFLLVTGFMVYVLSRESRAPTGKAASPRERARRAQREADRAVEKRVGGAVALVTAVAAIFYLATFLPHYYLGWWGGIADLFNYYGKVIWYENSVASATHPYSAPWWSWPLMLRPIAYWQNFPPAGDVATIWGGGNPASWWGALTAMVIVGLQAIERRSLPRAFLTIGFLSYLLMWVPIGRTLFLYHYMPAVYLGYLALGVVLAECWEGKLLLLEKLALLFTLMPVMLLGLGPSFGAVAVLVMLAAFAVLLGRGLWDSRYVCALYVTTVLVSFVYFCPLWLALPIARSGYYARMWLQGPGLRNWI